MMNSNEEQDGREYLCLFETAIFDILQSIYCWNSAFREYRPHVDRQTATAMQQNSASGESGPRELGQSASPAGR